MTSSLPCQLMHQVHNQEDKENQAQDADKHSLSFDPGARVDAPDPPVLGRASLDRFGTAKGGRLP